MQFVTNCPVCKRLIAEVAKKGSMHGWMNELNGKKNINNRCSYTCQIIEIAYHRKHDSIRIRDLISMYYYEWCHQSLHNGQSFHRYILTWMSIGVACPNKRIIIKLRLLPQVRFLIRNLCFIYIRMKEDIQCLIISAQIINQIKTSIMLTLLNCMYKIVCIKWKYIYR